MRDTLVLLLRLAGTGLITLAILHVPIGRHLRWREDAQSLSPVNASIFHVHGFFICLALVLMGLPCVGDPSIFIEKSRAALWGSWSLAAFWAIRLYCQFFVYSPELWRGRRLESSLHWVFVGIWSTLALLFGFCASVQSGWVELSPAF